MLEGPDEVSGEIVDAAIKVHRCVGPGLLESTYVACLTFELQDRGLRVRSQIPVPIVYEGREIKIAYRIDLLVEETVIVEAKAVSKLLPVHEAQLLSYLRMRRLRVGLLLNFHAPVMKEGIQRVVNGW